MSATSVEPHLHPATGPPTALRLACAPIESYRRLRAVDRSTGWPGALARPALAALVTGTAISMAATGRVTIGLVLSVSLYWAFASALQLCAGTLLIASARGRAVTIPHALQLFFRGHLPWSLWLLGIAAVLTLWPPPFGRALPLAASALVPLAWTMGIVAAFCRTVLDMTARRAAAGAVLHQSILWTATILWLLWLTDSWARVAAMLGA